MKKRINRKTKYKVNMIIQNANEEIEHEVTAEKYENKRSNRLQIIIGIIAIFLTIATVLFQISRKAINVWPETGQIYYLYMWLLFIAPLGASVIMFIEIICYVIGDLNRYNIMDKNHGKFDVISDKRFSRIVSDFRFLMESLCFIVFLGIPVSVYIYGGRKGLIILFIVTLISVRLLIILIILYWKNLSLRKIGEFIIRVGALIVACVLIIAFVLIASRNKTAILNVSYSSDGGVTICNMSDENFGGLKISVYDISLSKTFSDVDINKNELLFAKETKHIRTRSEDGKEIGSAQVLNGEMLYWKYRYPISNVRLNSGHYIFVISFKQEDKSVKIMNEFYMSNGAYIYAKNKIKKEY